jgi:outer membrane protein OmpU
MKKILLATTMLIGTAGFAAAEVSVSGNARMGIVNDGADTTFNSRVRASVSMSGETDGGLSFGGSFGIHDAGAAAGGEAGSVYISGAFGKLSFGDNDSAAKAAVGQVAGVGYVGVGDKNEIGYLPGNSAENVLYTYSAGAITAMVSMSQTTGDHRSVGLSYAGEGFGVSLGVEDNGGEDNHVVIGANTSMSGVALKVVYGSLGDLDQYAISATYSADALSVTAFTRSSFADVQASGIGVGYDLGGGASFAAGYAKAENEASGSFDAGINFSF